VHRDKVEFAFKVRPEDILWSAGMTLIVDDRISKADVVKGAEAHRQYLLRGMVLLDADGQRLEGKIIKVDSPAVPEAGIPLTELLATSFVYRVEYPLARPPARLGFQQHFNTGENLALVVTEATIIREGQDTGITIPVPGGDTVETLAFDWNNPAALPTEVEPVKPAAREPTDLFFYIQNDEVRVEILMPVATLETWLPVVRANYNRLEVAEQTALRAGLEKFFAAQNELKIDGVTVRPRLERLDFFGPDTKDFSARPEPKPLDVMTARVAPILVYSTKGAPRQVELKWTLFNNQVTAVRPVLFAYEQSARFALTPAHPTFTWTNPGVAPVPKIEAVLARQGAGTATARAVLAETLLRNVYRGFDYRAESDIYDALAQSVAGGLLTDLYLKIKQGLIVQEQGGAVARVNEVKVTQAGPADGKLKDGFIERVTWQVTGTVEHWGHIHTRVNEYTADLGIAPAGGAWKIVSLDVTKQTQVKSAMSVRTL
jgi:hypothetical protein